MRSLWLAWMHSAGDYNCFFEAMIFYKIIKTSSKVLKRRTCCQEVIFIILKKTFNFFFKSCFKQFSHPTFGCFSLSRQFFNFLIFLSISLLNNRRNLLNKLHFLVVIKISFYIFCYC